MDDDELGTGLARTFEQSRGGGHAARDLPHLAEPDDLEAHGPVVRVRADVEELIGECDDFVPGGHEPVPYGGFGV